ncbi:MAG: radical SAM protein [Lachnospiraceae bacterium]
MQNNINIVSGAKHHCIYDLNTQKLYNLDTEHLEYLYKLVSDVDEYIPESVRDFFIKEGIVVDTKSALLDEIKPFTYERYVNFAWIEVTQKCNLYCRHCYESSSKNVVSSDMTMDDFHLAVSALKLMGIKRIQLVGGEPLVHPYIADMINIAKDSFDFVEIYTNGTLLTEELLQLIANRGIALAFSLYSDDCSVHDLVTCIGGSHELTVNSINKALNRGVKVRVASVEMKGVPRYIFDDKRVMARSDLPRIIGRAGLHLYSKDMLRRKLITKDTFRKPISVNEFLRNKKIHNCFGSKLYINYKLDVYPCVMERRLTCGNLKDTSIKQMVGGPHVFLTKDKIEGCKDCEFRYTCFDCRPDSNGDGVYDKPWFCTYDPYKGIWADIDEFIDSLLVNL